MLLLMTISRSLIGSIAVRSRVLKYIRAASRENQRCAYAKTKKPDPKAHDGS